jgi:hypothetical protein
MAELQKFPLVGVREFRENIATYKEPVTVIHTRGKVKVLGYWYPATESRSIDPSEKSPNLG